MKFFDPPSRSKEVSNHDGLIKWRKYFQENSCKAPTAEVLESRAVTASEIGDTSTIKNKSTQITPYIAWKKDNQEEWEAANLCQVRWKNLLKDGDQT